MNALFWFLVVLNFVICAWDAYASGYIWGRSDDGRGNDWLEKLLSVIVFILSYAGFAYTFILIAIGFGVISEEWLLAANVFIGGPIIVTGVVIWIHGIITTVQERSLGGGLVSVWNTFAIIHNVQVWFESLSMLKEMGGLGGLLKSTDDDDSAVVVVALLAVILSTLFCFSLFRAGAQKSREFIDNRSGLSS